LSASKVYDGTTALSNSQVTIGTGINGESLTATGATASDAHAATADKFISTITLADGSGGLASNYKLPTTLDSASAPVTINPAPLTAVASISGSLTKTYDGTTDASGATVGGTVTGGIAGDVLNLNTSGITLTYNSSHVSTASKVTASSSGTLSIASSNSNSAASDYIFTAPTIADAKATITAKVINPPTITGLLTKMFDGSTDALGATLSGPLTGAVKGDTFTFDPSSFKFSYEFSQAGPGNNISVKYPTNYKPGLTESSVGKISDYDFSSFTIAPVRGAIIPVVTIVMPTIQPTVAASAPASSASSGASPSGGDTGAQGGGTSSSGTGGSSNTSSDAADSAGQ
ncbi:MAG: hypothetical protein EBU46_17520, partial [Nitrosomonadaceae bacterium]|nr:hypothetical protein [Nitrosomonadaceae bacterium]